MSAPDVVAAVDQGTGSTKAIALDAQGRIVARAERVVSVHHPRPGWVEQDADEIAASVVDCLNRLRERVGRPFAAIGLSTQRESALAWETASATAVGPVLGWQDRRTSDRADALMAAGEADTVRSISGLPLSPMFSALKFTWILDQVDRDRLRTRRGDLTLGTVDSWLVAKLTGDRRIEAGNASRTQLVDHRSGEWSDALLEAFDVPRAGLPDIVDSDAPSRPTALDDAVPITGVLGDSHAALFGHGIRAPSEVKVTYGTGSSIMGLSARPAGHGVADTIAWSIDGRLAHAFEGNILAAGATLVWLSELLSVPVERFESLARAAEDAGVDLVPAFAGLGAPWWDADATGMLAGLTLGTGAGELARAAFEAIVLQVEDVLAAAEESGSTDAIAGVFVDGRPSLNDWLMQLQADLSQRRVVRPEAAGLSALGAAWLAGASIGLWDVNVPPWGEKTSRTFSPRLDAADAESRRTRWRGAVARARSKNR